jgi:hypothetical protein
MSAREHGAWARTWRSTTARLVARTSAKSAGCGPLGVVIIKGSSRSFWNGPAHHG